MDTYLNEGWVSSSDMTYHNLSITVDPLSSLSRMLVHGTPFLEIKNEVDRILRFSTKDTVEQLCILMFKTRDVRGRGERLLFRHIFLSLHGAMPRLAHELMDLIPQYGYWKDFFHLALENNELLQTAMAISYTQLLADERALSEKEPLSLFAKWIPKEGKAQGRFAKEFANYIYKNMDMSFSQKMSTFRRRIVRLNAALNTVETLQCANRWDKIEPKNVPSIALKKYKAAFLNETLKGAGGPHYEKRLICREKFQNHTRSASSTLDDGNYECVSQRVRDCLEKQGLKGIYLV